MDKKLQKIIKNYTFLSFLIFTSVATRHTNIAGSSRLMAFGAPSSPFRAINISISTKNTASSSTTKP